jgi:GNAT superfamily N-acetyltransferase
MNIVDYDGSHLAELTALYNDLTQSVPHCLPIEAEELAAAFGGECGIESYGDSLTTEVVFVAIDREAVGFVHVGEASVEQEHGAAAQGVIRFLAYPRGRRDVGQALLDRAEKWLYQRQLAAVTIFPQTYRYPFYAFGHAYLSNHLDHVQSLLFFNGYHCSGGEIFLDWLNMDPDPPRQVTDLRFDLDVEQKPSRGRLPHIALTARKDKQHIGECILVSASAFSRQETAEKWAFCMSLNIVDPFQGRGLGRYLLGRALVEARSAGYSHAGISAAWDNHRALLFYSNYGFHAVDWTRQFSRTLSPPQTS